MDLPDELRRIFDDASAPMSEHLREQLAYRHMMALSDVLVGWALDERLTAEQSVRLVGWAESVQKLAEEVGPEWNPPAPKRLTFIGFLARKFLGE